MNNTILLGAYGWRHSHWNEAFYPEDLPADWQLSYYSNEFECVLVPEDYWQPSQGYSCEDWLDDVADEFQFFLALPAQIVNDEKEKVLFIEQVTLLRPQLSALVTTSAIEDDALKDFFRSLGLPLWVFDQASASQSFTMYRDQLTDEQKTGRLSLMQDDLSNLRQSRENIESLLSAEPDLKAIIVDAAITGQQGRVRLQPSNLSKLRSVMDIMGC